MLRFSAYTAVLLLLSSICACKAASEAPTAETPKGRLTGKYLTSRNGNPYEAFVGIRFGVVPGRFQNSILSPAWEGVKDATEFGSVCPQVLEWQANGTQTVAGDEDCLFLNVYTPKSDGKKRPVLVFTHGGGYFFGNGDPYGAKYFMDEDIVFVTINYRLGILGFLNTGDEHATGNMGLKDQVLALKWIQENIEAFGGDPSKVTISGESAGAGSVVNLVLSPTAKGLFHGAVAQSGTVYNPWAYKESTLSKAVAVGKHFNCDTSTTAELVACLKQKSVAEVAGTQGMFVEWRMDPMIIFMPSLDTKSKHNPEPFFGDTPSNLIRAGKFNRVPILFTVNKEEGSLIWAASIIRNPEALKDLNENWERVAPITFMFKDDPRFQGRSQEIAQKIRKFYFDNQEITPEKEENLTNLYSDSWFFDGIHRCALEMSKYTSVYTGLVTHRRKDFSMLSSQGITENIGVTTHGDELPFLFSAGNPESPVDSFFLKQEVSEPADVEFSKGLVKIITSFAKTGIPEITLGNSPSWSPVTSEERKSGQLNWLSLNLQPNLQINPFEERMNFWKSLPILEKDEL